MEVYLSMQLNEWFITGLVEGEGCFSISFNFREKLNVKIETRPSFSLSLNKRDLNLIKALHEFFKCGSVRFSRSDQTYKFEVRSIDDLIKIIIPHFKNFPLQGDKLDNFTLFEDICNKVHANLHRSPKHLRQIIELSFKMNPSGKRKHKKDELLKIIDKSMV